MAVANVGSKWSSGVLQFFDKATGTILFQIDPTNLNIGVYARGVLAIGSLAGGSYTMTAAQALVNKILVVTTAHATNKIIAPLINGVEFAVVNSDAATAAIIGGATGSTVSVAPSTTTMVWCDGTNYYAIAWTATGNVTLTGVQTLTNKTMTAPIITLADITFAAGGATGLVAAHDYGAAHADWTLSATEKLALKLTCTNASQAANIVAPAENRSGYTVYNNSGFAITIKASGQTGIAIANGKYARVVFNGTDYERLTPDL